MRKLELGEDILSSADAASSVGDSAREAAFPDGPQGESPPQGRSPPQARRAGGKLGGESRGSSPERMADGGGLPASHPLATLAREMSPEGIELVANFMRAIVADPLGGNRKLVAREEGSRGMELYEA